MQKTLQELAEIVDGDLSGNPDTEIEGIAGIKSASKGQITFLSNGKYREELNKTNASAIVVGNELSRNPDMPTIRVSNPDLAFARIAEVFDNQNEDVSPGIHETAHVEEGAQVSENACIRANVVIKEGASVGPETEIMSGSYIGKNVEIGAGCRIFPNTTIREKTEIGSEVLIHSGSVIGCDGFGYVKDENGRRKIPQEGKVVIEDRVEIGAGVTVDRARFDETRICEGTKIDNLVQIAHNVRIGKNAVIVAQSGIAGSAEIGEETVLAGQSGVGGHLTVGSGVKVAARAGVTKDIEDGEIVSGFPAMPRSEFNRKQVLMRKLPDMARQVEELQEEVERLQSRLDSDESETEND